MKKNYIWGAIVLAVILIGLAIWRSESKNGEMSKNGNGNSEDILTQNPDQQVPNPTPSTAAMGGSSAKLSYGDAVKKYQYRIQLAQCHGNPGTVSLKTNTPLMLDNRDAKIHTLKVAGQTYSVKSYDYTLAYFSKAGTYELTCDGGGAATVNIEK